MSEAGGIGFLAAGYKTAAATQAELQALRTLTSRPIGLNLFYPTRDTVDEAALEAYADRMRGEAERYGVAAGELRWTDDDWMAKLDVVARERPEIVSFTFGCPERELVEWLNGCGCRVWCTVTSVAEAELATSRKVDALVVQGAEAGGHQGSFENHDAEPRSLLALLGEIGAATALPRIAAGGIADGRDISVVLHAGAVAAQIGSALLLATEAGTSTPHRRALAGDEKTQLTRAFTGRRARGIVNRFMRDQDAFAPPGYPEIHYLTTPIRAAAREVEDADGINLWAGTSYRRAQNASASELVERWAREASARY